jgi:hypothetical protein
MRLTPLPPFQQNRRRLTVLGRSVTATSAGSA